MTLVSADSPVTAGRRGRRAAGRRALRAAAFALCGGAFALVASVAGCASSAAPMTPRTAISLAADKTQSVTSMTATFSDQITGTVAASRARPRSAALGSLTPALRKQIEPLLKLVSGDIRFNAWIDAEHVVRRVTEVETVSGETVHSTINVTSVNRPVHVTPPPASETVVPKSDPGGM
jgi:hypothetical protein